MKSIIDKGVCCYFCGSPYDLEKHHIFGGPNRKLSEEDGLTVTLCAMCHREGRTAVHRNKVMMAYLHKVGETAWINKYGTLEEFRERYGKNYL